MIADDRTIELMKEYRCSFIPIDLIRNLMGDKKISRSPLKYLLLKEVMFNTLHIGKDIAEIPWGIFEPYSKKSLSHLRELKKMGIIILDELDGKKVRTGINPDWVGRALLPTYEEALVCMERK